MIQTVYPLFKDVELQTAFARNGWVVVPFLSRDRCAQLAQTWRAMTEPIHRGPFSSSSMSGDQEYRSSVDETLLPVMAELTERLCDYRIVYTNFVNKRAGSTMKIPYHQDPTYVDEERFQAVNIWVPLVDVGPHNGCLRVASGSHTVSDAVRGTYWDYPYNAMISQHSDVVESVPMEAGSALIFSQRLIHGSLGNVSTGDRLCIGAVSVPRAAQLFYAYQHQGRPEVVEFYDATDEFYRRNGYGAKPVGLTRLFEREFVTPITIDHVRHARLEAQSARA